MIKNRFTILFLLCTSLVTSEDLTLTRIDVVGNDFTRAEVIRGAFLEVAPGVTLSREKLDEAAELAHDRLVNWGYFSSVLVTVVTSQSNPGTARLVVEVAEGFLGRYGGGPIWVTVGHENFWGAGQDGSVSLGWNKQSALWTNNAPGWRGGSWSLEGGSDPVDWTDRWGSVHENHGIGGAASLTQAWGWGWSTTAFQDTRWDLDPDYGGGDLRTDQGAALTWDRTPPGFSPDRGARVSAEASVLLPQGVIRQEGDLRAYVSLVAGWKAAFRIAGATQQGTFGDRDAQVASGFDRLRKPFDAADLARTVVWTSAELRWTWPDIPFFGLCPLTIEPALIADAGQSLSDSSEASSWDAGGALRVFWEDPVHVPLRIEATVDNQSRWWWGLAVEAPY
jgi:hypothetical protein